jgi:putative hydrolase of the HAD superfamily
MQSATVTLPWSEIDTVLLDMDGTLLDLAFDNFFWLELVPSEYARLHGLEADQARAEIKRRYEQVVGSLPWYCVDHWSRELGLDIRALKWRHKHLIRYLPMVPEFLVAVRGRGKRLLLVTNAHRETLAVKVAQTGIDAYFDALHSSHDFDAPKESATFWRKLQLRLAFDCERTMLIEDSLAVLAAARDFGIRHTIAIRAPDSGQPARQIDGFSAVNGVADLI